MTFMLLIIAAAGFTVVMLLLPIFSGKRRSDRTQRHDINIAAAAARLSELKEELEAGHIDRDQFQRYRTELEAMTLNELQDPATGKPEDNRPATELQPGRSDTILAVIIALLIPFFSLFTYKQLGSEQAIAGAPATPTNRVTQREQLENTLVEMEARVRADPDNVEGRIILGQIYAEQGRYGEAAIFYKEAYQLRPYEPNILVGYADALSRSHGNRLLGRPAELLERALEIAPEHKHALWLAGFAEMQANNKQRAHAYWRRLLAGLETGSESYQQIEAMLAEATDVQPAASDKGKHAIKVNVALAPQFQSRVGPNTTLFVFARASEGPPMPLAVYRGLAKELPLTVTLDESMAMMPQMSLASFPQVIVGARLSGDGLPQGQPGDMEGFSEVIETATTSTVDVLIDGIRP